eukprot:Gregarina_sp_Poly_1__2512@NODE_167_length_12139_cov_61_777005_g148_i0_p3_GENE_NODE_167_length_12139_cov_61_777005_g148_i0NODE_167_length_12139_cov_61_777005_g148_i0_p3_ORF_typecomplete_len527_score73_45TFIIF_alpha/PF05793_12/4_3_NODE_167_length_12139_cov_61_777005_g148_i0241583
MEGVASRLRALTISLDRPSNLEAGLMSLAEGGARDSNSGPPVARIGSINEMGVELPSGSTLAQPYAPSKQKNAHTRALPPRLDEFPPLPALDFPNLHYLHLKGFNPYREDHQRLLANVRLPYPRSYGLVENESSSSESEAELLTASPAPQSASDEEKEEAGSEESSEAEHSNKAKKDTGSKTPSPSVSPRVPMLNLPRAISKAGETPKSPGSKSPLKVPLLNVSGRSESQNSVKQHPSPSTLAPVASRLGTGMSVTEESLDNNHKLISRRHIHFELMSVRKALMRRHPHMSETSLKVAPVSHWLITLGHEKAATLHLVISLDSDCLGDPQDSRKSGCIESIETLELLARLVRKVNPMSLTLVPGPSPAIATPFLKLFKGSQISIGRGTSYETDTFPLCRELSGFYSSWTFLVLNSVFPLGMTNAPWSYSHDEAIKVLTMGRRDDLKFPSEDAVEVLLKRHAQKVIATHQYRKEDTGFFARMRDWVATETATQDSLLKVRDSNFLLSSAFHHTGPCQLDG